MNDNVVLWDLETGSGEHCVVRTEVVEKGFKVEGFNLQIFSSHQLWTGSFSRKEIEEFGKTTNRGQEYLPLVRETLCGQRTEDMELDFDVPLATGQSSKLMWKELKGDSVKAKALKESINQINKLKKECSEVVDSKVLIAKERDEAFRLLKTGVDAKESLEKDLMPVFLELLNSKKRKVSQIISNGIDESDETPSTSTRIATQNIADGDHDPDTDEENEQIQLQREPIVKKKHHSLLGDKRVESTGPPALPEPVIVPKKRKRGDTQKKSGKTPPSEGTTVTEANVPIRKTRSGRRSGSDSASLLSKMS